MKKTANAFAPAAECRVASAGSTGGSSPGRVFGPVVGTSAGTLGDSDGDGDEMESDADGDDCDGTKGIVVGAVSAEPVQPATTSIADTA